MNQTWQHPDCLLMGGLAPAEQLPFRQMGKLKDSFLQVLWMTLLQLASLKWPHSIQTHCPIVSNKM